MELVEFLEARIAEDEAALETARRMGVPPIPTGFRITSGIGNHPTMSETRMAAECAAKRRIVESIQIGEQYGVEQPRWVLGLLALPYADHPDYPEATQ